MKKEDIMRGGRYFSYFWICVLGGIGICLIVCFLLFGSESESGEGIGSDKTHTNNEVTQPAEPDSESNVENEEIPTEAPEIENKDEEEASMVTLGVKDEIQRELLWLFFNPDVRYGMEYGKGVLTSEGFSEAFYEGRGTEIGMHSVGIGDYAVGNGISGICVGYYEGTPVYAYMAEYAAYGPVENGVCLGYSKAQKDTLFYGMYPVAFDTYYKGTTGELGKDAFPECVEQLPETPWYTDLVYAYGRMMANVSTDALMEEILHERLSGDNQKLNRDSFEKFLKNLPSSQGFEGDYYLYIDSVEEGRRYTEVEVKFIPCGTGFYKPIGSWQLTLYPEYEKFLPCGVNYKAYMDVGFVRENNVTVTEEDGKVKVEKEEIIYGQTVDEEGRRIYRLDDGTIIYLE